MIRTKELQISKKLNVVSRGRYEIKIHFLKLSEKKYFNWTNLKYLSTLLYSIIEGKDNIYIYDK